MSGKWLIAIVVVSLVLGGSATAALKITGKDVKDASLTGRDVRNSSLTGADIKDRSLSARDFSESLRGPQGERGIQGPPGPTGATGFAHLDPHLNDVAVGANNVALATALCDPGEQILSGGYILDSLSVQVVTTTADVDTASNRFGWTVGVANFDTTEHSVEVIAYCAVPPAAATARAASRSRTSNRRWQQLKDLEARASYVLHLQKPHRP